MTNDHARSAESVEEMLRRRIIGAFYEVYNTLGFGHLESVYSEALAIELAQRGIAFEREVRLVVRYKGRVVGVYRADYVVERSVVLELKATAVLTTADKAQLMNGIRTSGLRVGLLLHFGPEPCVKRVVAPDWNPRSTTLRGDAEESEESESADLIN